MRREAPKGYVIIDNITDHVDVYIHFSDFWERWQELEDFDVEKVRKCMIEEFSARFAYDKYNEDLTDSEVMDMLAEEAKTHPEIVYYDFVDYNTAPYEIMELYTAEHFEQLATDEDFGHKVIIHK